MNRRSIFCHRPPRLHQRGIVSIVAAILLIAVVVFILSQTYGIIGNTSNSNAAQGDSVKALFLAESGVERAQAIIASAAGAGTLTSTNCSIDGLGSGSIPLGDGNGNFEYTSATPSPSPCGGALEPVCSSCTLEVRGKFNNSARVIRTEISTTPSQGLAGCGSDFTIPMPILSPGNGVVFSHVAYRAQDSATGCSREDPVYNSNARVGNCTITPTSGGDCNLVTATSATKNFWDIQGTGNKNISSMGVAGTALIPGDSYTVKTQLEKAAGERGLQDAIKRDYAQAAVVFYPPSTSSPAVAFMGTYESTTTSQTSGLTGSVNEKWTCQRDSATSPNQTPLLAMWRAGVSDSLVYGYSGWLPSTSSTATLATVTLGIQPLREITKITGSQDVPVYSQIWMTYNKGYYPSTASPQSSNTTTVTGATNGANFNGTIGATFTGTIASGILTLGSSLGANQLLAQGDTLFTSLAPTVSIGVLGTKTSAALAWGVSGSTYNVTSATETSSTAMLAKSTNLKVVGSPTGGALRSGDVISNASVSPTVTYGTIGASVACSTSVGPGPCATGDAVYEFAGTPTQTSATMYRNNGLKAITVPGSPVTAPAGGTAVAVPSGTGRFSSTDFTGTVAGDTLTLTTPSSVTLCAGDAIFSGGLKDALPSVFVSGIKSDTTVDLPEGTCESKTSFKLSRAVDVAITSPVNMVARTAVIPKIYNGTITGTTLQVSSVTSGRVAIGDILSSGGSTITTITAMGAAGTKDTYTVSTPSSTGTFTFTATNPKSFTVSRDPLINLSGGSTVVCGGVCAMLFPATGAPPTSAITFTLSGIPGGNDWSSGFACLQGVDAFNIQTLGKKVAKRSSWTEVVQ